MHRRNFLSQCGLAVAGALSAPVLLASNGLLQAAEVPTTSVAPALMSHLAVYSSRVYLWEADAYSQTTGLEAAPDTTHLLVRVNNLTHLAQFFRSKKFSRWGVVYAEGNTLHFTFQGRAYTVTNALTANFKRAKGETS